MPERVLTLRELNRTTLLRQLLLRRARLRPTAALERLAGLQAQFARSPYVALWARLEGFDRTSLERAVRRGHVVRGWLMRQTLHLASRRDYAQFSGALRASRLGVWQRRGTPLPPGSVERMLAFVREAPRRRSDLLRFVTEELGVDSNHPWLDVFYFTTVSHLEQSHESALWNAPLRATYAVVEVDDPNERQARVHLVRRYLAAYGPASRADLGQWTGMPLGHLTEALDDVDLRRFRDEDGRVLLDLPRARMAPATTRAPVRFLPWWDEVLLAYDRRARILPDEYRRVVIAQNGVVEPTVLVDGFVAGTWSLDSGRVLMKAFAPLPRSVRREVEDEARRLEAFVR